MDARIVSPAHFIARQLQDNLEGRVPSGDPMNRSVTSPLNAILLLLFIIALAVE
jgi:hypothetical protein